MSGRIHILLIIGSILFLAGIIFIIRKTKMSTDMASVWIVFALIIAFLAFFPNIAIKFGYFIGIMSSINAMFLVIIFILLCLVFYLFMKISSLENRLNNLIQIVALRESDQKENK